MRLLLIYGCKIKYYNLHVKTVFAQSDAYFLTSRYVPLNAKSHFRWSIQDRGILFCALTEFIHKEIKRGVTYIQCIGTFELKKNMMLKTLVKNDELVKIKNHLKQLDPNSFIYINESIEVHGRGFSE